jgi:hypothetical protein
MQTLDERQITLLTTMTSKVLRDPDGVINALKNIGQALEEMGATEQDIDAINNYFRGMEQRLKDSNNVGWW